MEITIVKDVKNPLLERREIEAIIAFQGPTPKRDEVLVELAKVLKVDDTHVEVDKIYQRFGRQEAKVIAFVFDKPVREKKVEVKEEKEEGGEESQTEQEGGAEKASEEKEEGKEEQKEGKEEEESKGDE